MPLGWVSVPHEGDHYYWNTTTDEVSWEHPANPEPEAENKPKFTEEHKVLWTDLGKVIGRQGINLKIIKASIGCTVKVPRKGGGKGKAAGKGKGKDGAGGKGKGKDKAPVRRGIGTGEEKLAEDEFATVVFTGDTLHQARGGKRCVEVMLGYARNVEGALSALGVEVKMPSFEELAGGKADAPASKEGLDPMDPAAYSDAPVGKWSAGMPKPGRGKGRSAGGGGRGQDAKTSNAERF